MPSRRPVWAGRGRGGGEAAVRRCRDGKAHHPHRATHCPARASSDATATFDACTQVTPHWRPAFPFPFPFSVARPRELPLSCRHYARPVDYMRASPLPLRPPRERAAPCDARLPPLRCLHACSILFPFLWNATATRTSPSIFLERREARQRAQRCRPAPTPSRSLAPPPFFGSGSGIRRLSRARNETRGIPHPRKCQDL